MTWQFENRSGPAGRLSPGFKLDFQCPASKKAQTIEAILAYSRVVSWICPPF
jgi:hypothetical protein